MENKERSILTVLMRSGYWGAQSARLPLAVTKCPSISISLRKKDQVGCLLEYVWTLTLRFLPTVAFWSLVWSGYQIPLSTERCR